MHVSSNSKKIFFIFVCRNRRTFICISIETTTVLSFIWPEMLSSQFQNKLFGSWCISHWLEMDLKDNLVHYGSKVHYGYSRDSAIAIDNICFTIVDPYCYCLGPLYSRLLLLVSLLLRALLELLLLLLIALFSIDQLCWRDLIIWCGNIGAFIFPDCFTLTSTGQRLSPASSHTISGVQDVKFESDCRRLCLASTTFNCVGFSFG